jgi:hypothetical protein
MQKYKHYNELTKEEIQEYKNKWIINWAWPKIKDEWNWFIKIGVMILNFTLTKLTPHFFQASADYHDYWYYIGGDERRRAECDNKFFYYMCRDIEWIRSIWLRIKLYTLAFIFFLAVRIFWKYSFNYK